MLKTKQRIIASIVSFSMMFSLVGPNLVLATGDETEPTITVETTLPSDDTDETSVPADETTSSSEETTESEEPAESKETGAPSESTSESTEETADPTDETTVETEESTEAPTEPTTEEENKEPTEKSSEPKETEPETPDNGKKAAPGLKAAPTRSTPQTATADVDAYAILYDSGKLVFQKGNGADESEGTVANSWLVTADSYQGGRQWNNFGPSITSIEFKDNIVGVTNMMRFFSYAQCSEITNIERIDVSLVDNFYGTFAGCNNLTSLNLSSWNIANAENFPMFIDGCSSLTTLNLDNWDFSNFTSINPFGGMFSGSNIQTLYCRNWTNIPQSFQNGFGRTAGLTYHINTIDCSNWTFQANTDLSGLFGNLNVSNLVLTNWDLSNVINVSQLFYGATISSIVLPTISSGTSDFSQMFESSNISTIDLSNVDMSGASNVSDMFKNASVKNLILPASFNATIPDEELWFSVANNDISDFSNAPAGEHHKMSVVSTLHLDGGTADYEEIYGISSASYEYIMPFPSNVIKDNYTFMKWVDAEGNEIIETSFDMPSDVYAEYEYNAQTATVGTDAYAMIYQNQNGSEYYAILQKGNDRDASMGIYVGEKKLDNSYHSSGYLPQSNKIVSVDVKDNIVGFTNISNVFSSLSNCTSFTNLDRIDMSQVTNMSSLFSGCNNIQVLEGHNDWDLSRVINANSVFNANSSNITSLDIKWTLPAVTNMNQFFSGQGNLVLTDDSYIRANTGSLTSISNICANCSSITNLDFLDLNTSNVIDTQKAFSSCRKLTDISNIADWNTNKVSNFSQMFEGCQSLESLDALSSWNMSKAERMSYMFSNCENLSDVSAVANWETSTLNTVYGMFMGTAIEEIDISGFKITSSTESDFFLDVKTGCEVRKVTIGESCTIKESSLSNSGLTGNWFNGTDRYTATELFVENTPDKANTYYKTFTFNFYPMGGTCTPLTKEASVLGFVDPDFEFPTPTKDGYVFTRWYDDNGRTLTEYPVGERVICVFAEYDFEVGYTLVLKPNVSGLEDYSIELQVNETYRLNPTIFGEFTDKRIANWSTKIDGTGTIYGANSAISNLGTSGSTVTLYAQWTVIQDLTVTAHYISLNTGEELYTSTVHNIHTGDNFDALGIAYDQTFENQDRIAFWATNSQLSLADYSGEHHYDAGNSPTGEPWSFNNYNQDDGLMHPFNSLFTADMTDIYAYIVPSTKFRILFPQYLLNYFPDMKLVANGVEYASGEYYLTYPTSNVASVDKFSTTTDISFTYGGPYSMYSNTYGVGSDLSRLVALGDISFINCLEISGMSSTLFREDNYFNPGGQSTDYNKALTSGPNDKIIGGSYDAYFYPSQYKVYIHIGENVRETTLYMSWENLEAMPATFGVSSYEYPQGYVWDGTWYNEAGDRVDDGSSMINYVACMGHLYPHFILDVDNPPPTPPPTVEYYDVFFDAQGGEVEYVTTQVSYFSNEGVGKLQSFPIATKSGFDFEGWYSEPNGQGTKYDIHNANIYEDNTVLYANWISRDERITVYFSWWGPNNPDYVTKIGSAPGLNFTHRRQTIDGYDCFGYAVVRSDVPFTVLPSGIAANDSGVYAVGWVDEDGNDVILGETIPVDGMVYFVKWSDRKPEPRQEENVDYKYIAYWSNLTGVTDNNLILVNTDNTANLHINFELGRSSASLSPESVEVKIPRYIEDEYGTTIAVLNTAIDVPEFPNTGETIFSYKSTTDYIILTNPLALNGGAAFNLDVKYTVSSVYGGDIINGEFTMGKNHWTEGSMDIIFDINVDADTQIHNTETMTVEYHSTDRMTLGNLSGVGYYEWPSRWGSEPPDSNLWVYVEWSTTAETMGTQGGSFTPELLNNNGGVIISSSRNQRTKTTYDLTIRAKYPIDIIDYDSGRVEIMETVGVTYSPTSARNSYGTAAGKARLTWQTYPQAPVEFYVGSTGTRVLEGQQTSYVLNNRQIDSGLTWQMGYKGHALPGSVEDSMGNVVYHWEPETLVFNTGVGDLYYSSGAGEKYNNWIPPTGNVQLNENDYEIDYLQFRQDLYTAEYYEDENKTYSRRQQETYMSYADSLDYDIYIRRAGEDYLTFYKTFRYSRCQGTLSNFYDMYLPQNTVEVEVRVNTKGYYYWDIAIVPTYTLKNTPHIRSLVVDDYNQEASSVLKFGAKFTRILYTGESVTSYATPDEFGATSNALLDLHEITRLMHGTMSIVAFTSATDVQNNTNKSLETSTYTLGAQYHSTTSVEYIPITKGTFFIMIPYGTEITDVTLNRANTNSSSIPTTSIYSTLYGYTIETIENYENTGNTLMIIHYDDPTNTFNNLFVSLKVQRRYRDILSNGTSTPIPYIFVSEEDTDVGFSNYTDTWNSSTLREQFLEQFTTILTELEDEEFARDYGYNTFITPNYEDWGFRGAVANSSGNYSTSINLYPGENYTYWMSYMQSPDTKAKDIKFYDNLDGIGVLRTEIYTPLVQGTSVDGETTLYAKGVVWYCTTENPDFENVDALHGWTTDAPIGETVYGVVVDYSKATNGDDFVLNGQKAINIYINKTNKDLIREIEFTNTSTLKESVFDVSTGTWNDSTSLVAEMGGFVVLPTFSVIKTSSPESGTEAEPAKVNPNQSIIYNIEVKNNAVSDDQNRYIENIHFVDTISDQLSFDVNDIRINGYAVDAAPNIANFSLSNGTISFDIIKLRCPWNDEGTVSEGESLFISIHTITNSNANGVIENTAYVTGYFDITFTESQTIASNTTYHAVDSMPDPTGLLNEYGPYIGIMGIIACAFVLAHCKKRKNECD